MPNDNHPPVGPDTAPAASTFPLNRVVAFLGPYVAIASGAVSTWLVQHFPGLHVDRATLGASITKAIVFAAGAGVTFALHHKWLDGWQRWETGLNQLAIAEAGQSPAGVASDAQTTVTSRVLASAANGATGLGNGSTYQPPETAVRPDPPLAEGEPTDSREG